MNAINYTFLPQLMLRTPFYSFVNYGLGHLPEILQKEDFRNAIFLASPDFYHVLEKKHFDVESLSDKEKFSLYKYYNRMSFRSTPFGSFASFTTVNWNEDQTIELADEKQSILHLLPDQKVRIQLFNYLKQASVNKKLILNPMCYRIGAQFRFIRTKEDNRGHNNFTLDALAAEELNVEILTLLKKSSLNYEELTVWISGKANCSNDEAKEYLDFLLEEQVIFSEHDGYIIDNNNSLLPGISETRHAKLSAINLFWDNWKNKSLEGMEPVSEANETLGNLLAEISIDTKGQQFYSAIERPVLSGSINVDDQNKLLQAIELLKRIAVAFNPPNLEKFITEFKERFDQEKVPLLLALDPDTGLGYGGLIDDRNGGNYLITYVFLNVSRSINL
jgi:hypothetical protein